MIVLDQNQYDFLINFLLDYKEEMLNSGLVIEPVAIKNNLWILPESVLSDERCFRAKQALIDGGHLQKMVIREIDPSELIESSFLQ